jgi:hypothetical protein
MRGRGKTSFYRFFGGNAAEKPVEISISPLPKGRGLGGWGEFII